MPPINLDDHGLAILPQPDDAELQRLAEDGVKTVINLRHEGEDPQPFSIQAEGERCQQLGMDYVSLPVSMKTADAALSLAFEKILSAAMEAGPTAVHCKLGQRAGAMVLIAMARHQQWDAPTALEQAGRLGLEDAANQPGLRAYITDCLS